MAQIRAVEAEVADAIHASSLHDLVVIPAAKASPFEELAEALGWTRKKLYRHIKLMPGVEKLDPSKAKSHFHIPHPIDSARRWNAGERRRV